MSVAAAVLLPLAALAVELDGIAARVGEDAILRSEVMTEMQRAGMPDGSQYARFLNEMIDRRLILRAARAAKMAREEWSVGERVGEIGDC